VGWPNINWGPGWGLLTLAMLNGTGTVESGRPHDVASAWSLLPRLADQVLTFYNGDDQAVQLLRSGDTVMTYRSTFEAGLLQREKVPVRAWTHLKENMIATNEAVSLVRSGDRNREELAAKFLNAALSPEAQLRLAEAFFTPINPMVKLPPALAGQLLSSREVERLNHFDWIWIGTQIDAWTEQWNKTIKRS
jgi:ABC-type thiamine transport system substrate-binding protein